MMDNSMVDELRKELDYYRLFRRIILDGILFGMTQPGEMWTNYNRILSEWDDLTLPFFYKSSRRFFNDLYEVYNAPIEGDVQPEKVKEWIKTLYPDTHRFKEGFVEDMLWAYDYTDDELETIKEEPIEEPIEEHPVVNAYKFDRDIFEYLSCYWEVCNDSYHRFYTQKNFIGKQEIFERMISRLNELGIKTNIEKNHYVLINFSW